MRQIVFRIAALAALIAGACVPSPSQPTALPPRGEITPEPTTPPPAYREPFLPVDVENAPEVELLGRLDPPRSGVGSVTSYAFAPDSTRLTAVTRDLLLAWDLLDGSLLFSSDRRDAVRVFYSVDKTEIYTLDNEGGVRAINGLSGSQTTAFNAEPDYSGDAAYEPFEGVLAVASRTGQITMWEPFEREQIGGFQAGDARITDMQFSTDGNTLAVSNSAGAVELWNWRAGSLVAVLATGVDGAEPVGRVALRADGMQIAAGTPSDVRLWDPETVTVEHILLTGEGGSEDVLAYTPDGRYLVNSGTTEAMNIWDPATGELIIAVPELGGQPTATAFNPAGNLMLASVFQGGAFLYNLAEIDTETGITRAPLEVGAAVIDVAWSPDGRALVVFDVSGSAYVFGIDAPPSTDE